ncbi:28S ribosomal protein S9, mitochondrial [Oopsacas minuta]|uniref:28S ribosomal protein S9, mitochondrial n=1 Tax=Oopsacas minuta TaxID=111878 RepID=A0AAV7JKV5_9METZ|nr:28S ribosomal protein S9, mitochondrial [Oopsacas minuta]
MYRTTFITCRSFLTYNGILQSCYMSTLAKDTPLTTYSKHYKEQMKHYIAAKHRLAKMMGANPVGFTEKDMKEALNYLLPHHIRPIPAKPQILHPELLRRRDRVEFKVETVDRDNRPLEAGFYMRHPCFQNFQLITIRFKRYLETEDITFKPNNIPELPLHPDCTLKTILDTNAFKYADKEAVELAIGEILTNWHYDKILAELTELINHPNADDDVLAFVRPFFEKVVEIDPLNQNTITFRHESGCQIVQENGTRKSSIAVVQVWLGEGYIIVNGKSVSDYFTHFQDVMQIIYPLQLIGVLGKYSMDCKVIDGGHSGQSGAIRLALAQCLAFLEPQAEETLSNAGLLWRDIRRREGKKPGRMRARRGYTWRKR